MEIWYAFGESFELDHLDACVWLRPRKQRSKTLSGAANAPVLIDERGKNSPAYLGKSNAYGQGAWPSRIRSSVPSTI